ncbi:hypothetical protein [Fervidibacillus albus]|uniref:Uncharacterized protein n=1 Tax=Fervidibacillus albus TaxID=2980026 RepID=A0A9E8LSV7_9BACI|nr:hypothetical protein [Fervidibacillus albus]WAA08576.1 hypothetical protein OE104_07935 [Fervidibacillus albus]
MSTKEIAAEFVQTIQTHFPNVKFKQPTENRSNRISIYVPNSKRNKRWMQVDWNKTVVNIAMDHLKGEISKETVESSEIPYGKLDGNHTRIILADNDDAVKLSIFINEPVDFKNQKFIGFLKEHFESYLRRVGET